MEAAQPFGHGHGYFDKFDTGPHNTFISILGQYGYVPLACYFGFLLMIGVVLARRSLSSLVRVHSGSVDYSVAARGGLYFYLAFFAYSLVEVATIKPLFIVSLIMFGFLVKRFGVDR